MMNYEEMSDFEVNAAVSGRVLWGNRHCEEIDCNDKTGIVSWADGANWHGFNPCNNPSDAWPIINSIFWELVRSDELGVTEWAKRIRADDGSDKLRAAMIVFLMMRDEQCQKS